MLGTHSHHALVPLKMHVPFKHVVVTWIVYAAVWAYAFLNTMNICKNAVRDIKCIISYLLRHEVL